MRVLIYGVGRGTCEGLAMKGCVDVVLCVYIAEYESSQV